MKWRWRFSLRTVAILMTLICCYFGCWSLTKHFGLPALARYQIPKKTRLVYEQTAPVPFVIAADECRRPNHTGDLSFDPESKLFYRRYYVWIFGLIFETPFKYVRDVAYISAATLLRSL